MQGDMSRMNSSEPLLVDCEQFGKKLLARPTHELKAGEIWKLQKAIAENWDSYWSALYEVTSELAEQVLGVYDFDASFETHDFQLEIYSYQFSNDIDHFMFRVAFLDADSREICPVFDTTFESLEVVHSQACF